MEYALITGGSKGIGKAMAVLLAQKGYGLLLVSRSEAELKQLAEELGTEALYLAIDLSQPGAAQKIADWCSSYPVSILINNAGYGAWGEFNELELNSQINMLQLNINALVELTHFLLPRLKQQPQSYILNVSSTAAYQAVPTLAVYAASKAFVLSFSRAIKYELKDTNTSVTCLCPGPTDTGFAHRAGMDALADLADKFNMTPQEVARVGINAMFNKQAEVIPGLLNRLSAIGARLLNKSLIERITGRLYDKVKK
jgi:short-subunit dehydrogenase